LINTRVGPSKTDTQLGELTLLHRIGLVSEFCTMFMAISCRDHSLTEQQQVLLFTTGLGDPLHIDVAL
jgi:hypothetical protein